jgi:hypothetical protein
MLIIFIPSLVTGILLWLVPEGYRGGRGAGTDLLIGLTRGEWKDLHMVTGIALAAHLLLHLLLHIPSFRNVWRTLFSPAGEREGE